MIRKIPHLHTADASEKPFLADSGAKFFAYFRHFSVLGLFLAVLTLVGCSTPGNRPVVVQVTDIPENGGRFRSAERQRDVWIAPQAIGNEILQHEQVVTFVEKPQGWRVPSTLEPHTVVPPDLPLESGEYDGAALQRQQEIIQDKERQIQKTTAELENIKGQTRQDLSQREQQIQAATQQLQETREKLNTALQKLDEIEQAERRKREEAAKPKPKPWWKPW
jgi:hypothetical protein